LLPGCWTLLIVYLPFGHDVPASKLLCLTRLGLTIAALRLPSEKSKAKLFPSRGIPFAARKSQARTRSQSMKQVKFILLTLVVVVCAAAALTQASGGSRMHNTAASRNVRARTFSSPDKPLANAAAQRWRLGGATHWRSLLLQR
jgi:hypothetical protein